MAFPVIPDYPAGSMVGTVQADTNATRTFPDITNLTESAGDLLIAIVVAYQCPVSTASFSGWTAGWTELADLGNSATPTMAIGVAYKWSDGASSGAPTVTQATTVTGHAALAIMAVHGAHASTPPEVSGTLASGTTTAADPAALTPSWGAEDTLWVAVAGVGEVSTSGSYTGVGAAPANYTGFFDVGSTADVAGAADLGLAFRQLNAASENVGTFTVDTSSARNCALVIAVRPAGAATPKSDTESPDAIDAGERVSVTLASTDVARVTDAGEGGIPVSKADTEAARAADAQAVQASLASAEAARAADAQAVTAQVPVAETARTAEAASITSVTLSAAEAAWAAEAAQVTASLANADTARGSEAQALSAALSAAEAARTADAGEYTVQPRSDADAARGSEAQALSAALSTAEAVQAVDAGEGGTGATYVTSTEAVQAAEAAAVTAPVTSTETVRGTEGGELTTAPYTDTESAQAAEAQTVSAALGSTEAGVATEAAAVAVTLASAEATQASESASTATSGQEVASSDSVRAADAGELTISLHLDSDRAAVTEAQAVTAASLADTDRVSGAETGQFRALSAADAGQLRDAGETATSLHLDSDQAFAGEQQAIQAALRDADLDKAADNSEQVSGVSAAETTRVADNQAVSSLVSSAESCVASESAPPARATLASADSAEAADTQQIAASLADAEVATVASAASPALAGVVSADAAVVNVAASVPFAQVTSAETVRGTDAGESGTGGAAPRFDAETIHVVDSDITYYASADSAAVADAGERIRATRVRDTERVRVIDAVGPPGGTWVIFSAERVRVTDAGCWSGPLADAEAVRVTDDEEDIAPWTLTDDDYVTATDDLPPLHVYAYALAPGGLLLRGIRVLEVPKHFDLIEPVKPTVTAHVTLVISPALNVTFDAVQSGAYNGGIESGR